MARKPKGWHRERIKAALRMKFGPITHLSASWGYHRPAITNCLADARYSRPLEKRISIALGVPPCVLWPDRWHETGEPVPMADRPCRCTGGTAQSSQKMRAA